MTVESTGPIVRGDAAQAPRPQMGEIGAAGTRILAGIIYDETNPRLQGQRAFGTYTQMRFDPSGAALHKVYDLPIRSARWFVEPASDAPGHIKQADFIHDQLWEFGSQTMDDVLRLANLAFIYGFTPLEIVYRLIEDGPWKGKVGWDKFAWRNPATKWRWVVDEVNGRRQLLGLVQKPPPTYQDIFIPANKLLLFINDLEGENFDGWSQFRPCFKPWFYRDALYRIQAVGLERGFMGIPWAKLPVGYSAELRDLAKKIVESMRTDEQSGFVHPEDLEVGILSNKLEGLPMQHAIDHHTRMFWVAGLAQVLDLGSKAEGSFALSSDQSDLLQMAINAPANRQEETFNLNPCIPQIIRFNFPDFDPNNLPRLQHGDIGQRNLERLGRVLAALGQFGFLTPDDPTEDKLRQMLDLPERDENFANRDLWDLIQTVQPSMQDWRQRTEEEARLRPSTLIAPGSTPLGRGTPRAPVGSGAPAPVAAQAPAALSENGFWRTNHPAYELWRQMQPMRRPRGRVTQEQREAGKATEDFAIWMSEQYGATKEHQRERPSQRVQRLRRAYQLRSEPLEFQEGDDFLATDTSPGGMSVSDARARVRSIRKRVESGDLKANPAHPGHSHVVAQTAVIDAYTTRIRDRLRPERHSEKPLRPEPKAPPVVVNSHFHLDPGAIQLSEPERGDMLLRRQEDGSLLVTRRKPESED